MSSSQNTPAGPRWEKGPGPATTYADLRRKRPLGIPESDRRDLLDMLLRINRIAMQAFDAIEADAWDMDELRNMLDLPDACNAFTAAMERQANRIKEGRR